ncbi:EmrB/QacA subfamily drug resistance transporter [Chitinophaga skermanii]|uniref:EmrB/QacA subfamily drug resistance transporter n=1 Tax=Chitinophaga skermanii TaxID=331697 RepID=A0A327QYC2_9BACT|nr:DHA2 family efflux MFS transporter permease subunit [Chitinophaga skermanii]RAJ08423.1 EmrB/QacA subfamily drug resistance transporter [Chitinophaga skermanii]
MKSKAGLLVTLILSTLMAGLDSSIVNISLPTMQKQFDVRMDELQWIVTAYMLAFSVCMPLTNWLKDRIGFFALFNISVSVFTIGSLLCSLSTDLHSLVISRVIQAIGGGAISPVALSILTYSFDEDTRGKVLGWWGLGIVIGPALGPTLGGILTENYGWPSIFYINVPIGIVAVLCSYRYLGFLRHQPKVKTPFDTGGYIFFALFLVSFQLGITRLEKDAQSLGGIIAYFAVAVISIGIFIRLASKNAYAIIDLNLFKNLHFVSALLVNMSRSAALFGGVFLLPFLLQDLMHYTEIQAGLLLLPASVILAAMMPLSGTFTDKYGPRGITIFGLAVLAVTMYLFGYISIGVSVYVIIAVMVMRGFGLGCLLTPITIATVDSVLPAQVTMASSLMNLSIQISGAVGVALLSVIHQHSLAGYLAEGLSDPIAQHEALRDSFYVSTVILIVSIVPAFFLPKKHYKRLAPAVATSQNLHT